MISLSVVLETEAAVVTAGATPASPIKISNRERVIYPESKLTKLQLADYYAAVALMMLPWI